MEPLRKSSDSGLPELTEQEFPPFVVGDVQRRRWRASVGIARELFGEGGEALVWSATRAIYNDPDLPTE
jgi:hypothetical protein